MRSIDGMSRITLSKPPAGLRITKSPAQEFSLSFDLRLVSTGSTFAPHRFMPQFTPREFRISINSLGWTAYETRQRNYWKVVVTRGRTLLVCIGPKRSQAWKYALGQVRTHAILLSAAGWTAAI